MSKKIEKLKYDDDYFYNLAAFFSIFSDPTRLKILHALLDGEKCVKKISEIVGLNQSTCSHQLKILRQHKVVKIKREGRFVRYSLNDDHIKKLMNVGEEHLSEEN
ncbi:MAG: winged helix-turn-helix transcriptional regulator [Thermotogaceae bacterium]|nr:winged helix-turn-helix transcriptional regulator [Thermotogaceae bacterium]